MSHALSHTSVSLERVMLFMSAKVIFSVTPLPYSPCRLARCSTHSDSKNSTSESSVQSPTSS
jgi:hypothetical protein